jgi:hypothetical protein
MRAKSCNVQPWLQDWWALGVLIFEIRSSHGSFEAHTQLEMFRNIVTRRFVFPRNFDAAEKGLGNGLLQVDLARRLGNMHRGVDQTKSLERVDCVRILVVPRCQT